MSNADVGDSIVSQGVIGSVGRAVLGFEMVIPLNPRSNDGSSYNGGSLIHAGSSVRVCRCIRSKSSVIWLFSHVLLLRPAAGAGAGVGFSDIAG